MRKFRIILISICLLFSSVVSIHVIAQMDDSFLTQTFESRTGLVIRYPDLYTIDDLSGTGAVALRPPDFSGTYFIRTDEWMSDSSRTTREALDDISIGESLMGASYDGYFIEETIINRRPAYFSKFTSPEGELGYVMVFQLDNIRVGITATPRGRFFGVSEAFLKTLAEAMTYEPDNIRIIPPTPTRTPIPTLVPNEINISQDSEFTVEFPPQSIVEQNPDGSLQTTVTGRNDIEVTVYAGTSMNFVNDLALDRTKSFEVAQENFAALKTLSFDAPVKKFFGGGSQIDVIEGEGADQVQWLFAFGGLKENYYIIYAESNEPFVYADYEIIVEIGASIGFDVNIPLPTTTFTPRPTLAVTPRATRTPTITPTVNASNIPPFLPLGFPTP